MKWDPITRRQFLQGMGTVLAMPLLDSLVPAQVYAQSTALQKNFIGISAWNGLFRMYGTTSELMPRTDPINQRLPADFGFIETGLPHRVHHKQLSAVTSSNNGRISEIIDSKYNNYLNRMLMLQGFDYLSLASFHHNGQFGNFADVAGGSSGVPAMASIDQVMATSLNFYKNPSLVGTSVAYTASWAQRDYGSSFYFNDPTNTTTKNTAGVSKKSAVYNPATLWDSYFGGTGNNPNQNNLKGTIVDRILADYTAARKNPRLGAEDRSKLDRHITLLHETERKVKTVGACYSSLRPDSNLTDLGIILTAMNDVIVSLISCGLCHVFMGHAHAIISSNPDSWHAWSHLGYSYDGDSYSSPTDYNNVVAQNKAVLEFMCLDLVAKLDDAGQLDNSLVVWIQEHNKRGHECWNVPIIAWGGAGGKLRTGQYIDYRNFQNEIYNGVSVINDNDHPEKGEYKYGAVTRKGFPIQQAYATFLQAMDVPPSEFNALNKHTSSDLFIPNSGYGASRLGEYNWHHYYPGSWGNHDLNSYLPGIKI